MWCKHTFFGKSPFFYLFLSFFPVFQWKSWFFTRWSCFLHGFLEFVFFFSFFCVFFLFSDVKVDFSLGGPVFFLDSRNFGKSPFFLSFFPVFRCPGFLEFVFFFLFFLCFFPVFQWKSWFFTRWSCFLPGFLEFVFFFSFFCVFFLFSDVKVDFSLGGPVFFLDSRNFGKSPFFCLFFLFSDVLDSWNSCFFSLFFVFFSCFPM